MFGRTGQETVEIALTASELRAKLRVDEVGPRMVFSCSEDKDVHTSLKTMKRLECAGRAGRAA